MSALVIFLASVISTWSSWRASGIQFPAAPGLSGGGHHPRWPLHELEASNRESVRKVLRLIENEASWTPVVTEGRTKVWQLKNQRHACILAKGVLDADPEVVYELFAEARRAKEFNEFCEECVDVDRLSHDTKVSWSATKPFGLFQPRDFVTLCHYSTLADGSRVIVNRAATHDSKPVNPKRYQRAEILLAANIIRPHGKRKTHLTLVTHINPKGAIDNSIAASISNQIVKKSPVAFFQAIEKAASDTTIEQRSKSNRWNPHHFFMDRSRRNTLEGAAAAPSSVIS